MRIDLDCGQIKKYAKKFDEYNKGKFEDTDIKKCMKKAKRCGRMTRADLIVVAKFKSSRCIHHCKENFNENIKDVSTIAFSTESEFIRINILRTLHGVGWPMASTILHFANLPYVVNPPDGYPILDRWAMEAVREPTETIKELTKYSFENWKKYIKICRQKAKKCKVPMRTIDKALWTYGKYDKNK